MSFPRYPKYKPSGVEWLGDVPEVWQLNRIGYFFAERREQVSDLDFAALSVTKNGIVPQLDSAAKTDNGDNRKKVCAGDFAINSRSDRKGSAGVSELDGSVSVITTVLSPRESVHGHFVHHLLRSQPFQEEFYRFGKGIVADLWSTRYSEMRNIRLALPPLSEQTVIAEFLDRETAKIDELVAEQRRLMELLKEKRQAVISHAVTKGLNPNAPMKPSGIEWLGDVPKHWALPKLKSVATFSGGGTPSRDNPAYWNGDIPWVSPKDMKAERIEGAEESITDEGLRSSASNLLPPGRVLIVVRSGILKHTIPIAINETAVALNQDMKALSFDDAKCVGRFFLRWVQGHNEQLLFAWAKQGATVESIEHSYLAQTVVPMPAIPEQTAIIEFLEPELAKFDTLTAEAQRAIDLLQERRTALISAAVTGQIDVRDYSKTNRTN